MRDLVLHRSDDECFQEGSYHAVRFPGGYATYDCSTTDTWLLVDYVYPTMQVPSEVGMEQAIRVLCTSERDFHTSIFNHIRRQLLLLLQQNTARYPMISTLAITPSRQQPTRELSHTEKHTVLSGTRFETSVHMASLNPQDGSLALMLCDELLKPLLWHTVDFYGRLLAEISQARQTA